MSRPAEIFAASENAETEIPICEPEIIHPLFVDRVDVVTAVEGVVRLMAWVNYPDQRERRVVARLVITDGAARRLAAQLRGTFGPQH